MDTKPVLFLEKDLKSSKIFETGTYICSVELKDPYYGFESCHNIEYLDWLKMHLHLLKSLLFCPKIIWTQYLGAHTDSMVGKYVWVWHLHYIIYIYIYIYIHTSSGFLRQDLESSYSFGKIQRTVV